MSGGRAALDQIASSGGTKTAFVIDTTKQDVEQQFTAALNAIRGASLPCNYEVPDPRERDARLRRRERGVHHQRRRLLGPSVRDLVDAAAGPAAAGTTTSTPRAAARRARSSSVPPPAPPCRRLRAGASTWCLAARPSPARTRPITERYLRDPAVGGRRPT